MSDIFLVNVCHPREDLLHIILDGNNIDWPLLLLMVLNDVLQILLAVFKHNILRSFALLRSGVVNFEHPYHIFAVLQFV